MHTKVTVVSVVVAVGLLLIGITAPVHGHHAFSAEFDANKPIELKGTITGMEWVNPHSWLHLDVKKPNGTVEQWMVEGGPPTTLLKRGITKKSVQIGATVIVTGFQSRDGSCKPICRGNGRDISFTDGRKLFMGSSGTGAPADGKDPSELKK